MIGIPGGVNNKDILKEIDQQAKSKGIKLVEGKGDDPDTLNTKIVYVMDSNQFPFKQAEIYHQYHDGFMLNEQYPEKYNVLVKNSLKNGLISSTGCPDIIIK